MKNKTKLSFFLMLITGLAGLLTMPCHAVYEEPKIQNTILTVKYDRMAIPSRLTIWDQLSGGINSSASYNTPTSEKFLNTTLVCLSRTDTTFGACYRTSPVWWNRGSATDANISLKFTLEGTSTAINLTVDGRRRIGCSDTSYPASSGLSCWQGSDFTNLFTYTIAQNELAKLTTPGTWTATLKQNLWVAGGDSANVNLNKTWTANIILKVTDLNNQQIYFPAFPSAAPRVDLNLNYRSGKTNNATTSGVATLDMCLYDGFNASSNRISMLFRDEEASASGRTGGSFSVYRTGADKTKVANRIDYVVTVLNPVSGAYEKVQNGTEFSWVNTSHVPTRQVVLPGISGLSLCIPAPLRLTTAPFKLADKATGHYTGRLTIIFTPSTQSNVSL